MEALMLTNRAHSEEQISSGAQKDGWRSNNGDVRTWKAVLKQAAREMGEDAA